MASRGSVQGPGFCWRFHVLIATQPFGDQPCCSHIFGPVNVVRSAHEQTCSEAAYAAICSLKLRTCTSFFRIVSGNRVRVRTSADKVKALTAKKVPELVDAVQDAASEPGKAVSKAFKQARVCSTAVRALQAS